MKTQTNFRVVIEPNPNYGWRCATDKESMQMCEEITRQIKRHIDDIGYINVECDVICEFCRYNWEVQEDGQPACCDKAIEEWDNKKASQK